ncbi:lytic transglycosylase domain-containing protein [Flavobacterium sp. CBA20B-1]|uniref:lytic transglycosylase domain-containing protein n=1 Tax=unclassified Flavobacterium TaxID=196869 RepID=UPI0022254B95|nr:MULTISPECIES: lytic transglycosylase domain-containing protein [unclassified Flavobacterium]WCM42328.1 lytic transglycosylase domain-containing protein [Flavobacterium sp. CBA20B-1]
MKKSYKNAAIVVAILGLSGLFYQFTTIEKVSTETGYHIKNIDFCGERVPVEIVDVKERLDRELVVNMNLHSATTLIIKRANRYFPEIEPILKRNGIPSDFKYLCVIESALTNATSSAGAKGFWQFMPETAREYNLEISSTVDERYDVIKATEAACVYLKRAYAKFGNWTLVAASYNRGMAGVERQLTAQGVTDYYDLYLNEETSRYVFRILALKEIMNNTDKYGFVFSKDELYQPVKTKTVAVNANIDDLQRWALNQGINYKLLKWYNPWLIDTSLIVSSNKTYNILIPIEGFKRK